MEDPYYKSSGLHRNGAVESCSDEGVRFRSSTPAMNNGGQHADEDIMSDIGNTLAESLDAPAAIKKLRIGVVLALILGLVGLIMGSFAYVEATKMENKVVSDGSKQGSTGQPNAASAPTLEGSATLYEITQRGKLRCGIPADSKGFGEVSTSSGEYIGFDIDLCRAVGAAIFGTDNIDDKIDFVVVTAKNRFASLANGNIDVIARTTTHTMERDIYYQQVSTGFSFSVPYFFDATKFGGVPPFVQCADRLNITDCEGTRICVLDGTTTLDLVQNHFPPDNVFIESTSDRVIQGLLDGICNVVAGPGHKITEAVVRSANFQLTYEMGTAVHSREPYCLVTRESDPRWSDFVNWVLQAILVAEERDVAQAMAGAFAKTTEFGSQFELMFSNAVAAVGDYSQLYRRNLQDVVPRTGLNQINRGDSGLIFSHPYGNVNTMGPAPRTVENGMIAKIQSRGHIKCGITLRSGFGDFDTASLSWRGMDVDYCKALSAAIFDGAVDHVVYVVLPATERFKILANGGVDVLSRITTVSFSRDTLEPTSGTGFSFSQPTFYDSLRFGGIPPYAGCADSQTFSFGECQNLAICVNNGTTMMEGVIFNFPSKNIRTKPTGTQALMGLATGECNVIAGGASDVTPASVRDLGGYDGAYQVGTNRFTKEPLAMVTRQDDQLWSDLVYWVVSSTFYAEEQGITQATATNMPLTNLFGPLYSRLLINVIQAVGNYGEMYQRNLQSLVPREGQNLLNTIPFGPQLFPLPGV